MSRTPKASAKRKSVVVSTLIEVINKLEEITTACEAKDVNDVNDKQLINNL